MKFKDAHAIKLSILGMSASAILLSCNNFRESKSQQKPNAAHPLYSYHAPYYYSHSSKHQDSEWAKKQPLVEESKKSDSIKWKAKAKSLLFELLHNLKECQSLKAEYDSIYNMLPLAGGKVEIDSLLQKMSIVKLKMQKAESLCFLKLEKANSEFKSYYGENHPLKQQFSKIRNLLNAPFALPDDFEKITKCCILKLQNI
jgi:hypothetical protein